jgi:hypothetical protein
LTASGKKKSEAEEELARLEFQKMEVALHKEDSEYNDR